MYVFVQEAIGPDKVPYWGTGRAKLGKSKSIYMLITKCYWLEEE
jgi:hypothetical protein